MANFFTGSISPQTIAGIALGMLAGIVIFYVVPELRNRRNH